MANENHEQKAAGRRQAAVEIDADRGRRAIGAERVKRAVGDVEDFHDAEDQAQAHGDEKQIGRVDEPVGQDGESGQHERGPPPGTLPARRPPRRGGDVC